MLYPEAGLAINCRNKKVAFKNDTAPSQMDWHRPLRNDTGSQYVCTRSTRPQRDDSE